MDYFFLIYWLGALFQIICHNQGQVKKYGQEARETEKQRLTKLDFIKTFLKMKMCLAYTVPI